MWLEETHLPRQHEQSYEENEQWYRAHGLQIFKNTRSENKEKIDLLFQLKILS